MSEAHKTGISLIHKIKNSFEITSIVIRYTHNLRNLFLLRSVPRTKTDNKRYKMSIKYVFKFTIATVYTIFVNILQTFF